MSSENQRTKLTKKLLKESFIDILKTESIHKISIRELCEKAGINRSTFYKYYGSQYDLLADMEEELLNYIKNNISDKDNTDKDFNVNKLALLLSYLEENTELARLLINNNVDPEFPQNLISLPQIQYQLKKRLNKKYSDYKYEYVSVFTIQGAYNMVRMWINKDIREPAIEMAEILLDTVSGIF